MTVKENASQGFLNARGLNPSRQKYVLHSLLSKNTLRDGYIGKIVLCRHDGGYALWGRLKLLEEISNPRAAREMLEKVSRSPFRDSFYEPPQPPKGIPVEGGWLACAEGHVFIAGNLQGLKPIDRKKIQECLGEVTILS